MFDKLKRIRSQSEIVFKSRFLANLNPAERYEFLQLCHRRSYKEGEFVYYKNDPGTGMYFIEEGKVELTAQTDSDTTEEEELPCLELNPPESFGALSIGYDLRRNSSARCLTDSKLLGFFKPDFEVLRERHPKVAVKFLQTLTNIALRQLETTSQKLAEVTDEKTALDLQFRNYFEKSDAREKL